MSTYISIATYNESENIAHLLTSIFASCPEANAIVVDDDSPDGTGRIVDEMAASDPRIVPVHRPRKSGYASAHKQAIRMAVDLGAGAIVTMDADFSHDPTVIPALISALDDADIAIGSRYVRGGGTRDWPWHRRVLSAGANAFTRLLLGITAHDCTSGFRAYRADLIRKLNLDAFTTEGYAFLEESLFECRRLKARIAEVPIIFTDRQLGKSKLSRGVVLEAVWNLARLALRRLRRR
jgi:dolichol-phosphate mannosyltransferase